MPISSFHTFNTQRSNEHFFAYTGQTFNHHYKQENVYFNYTKNSIFIMGMEEFHLDKMGHIFLAPYLWLLIWESSWVNFLQIGGMVTFVSRIPILGNLGHLNCTQNKRQQATFCFLVFFHESKVFTILYHDRNNCSKIYFFFKSVFQLNISQFPKLH